MFNLKEFLGLGYYTSKLDEFLNDFEKNHPTPSAAQRREIEKYNRIIKLRDNPSQDAPKPLFWDKF